MPEKTPATLSDAWSRFVKAWHLIIIRWSGPLTFAGLLAAFVLLVLIARAMTPPDRITFLTGPKGSVGVRLGEALSAHSDPPPWWRFWEPRYVLTVQETRGFEDNRRRIDRDTTGRVVAFGHDGFNPTENLRILLPLEHTYLHVIASNDLLRESGWSADEGVAPRLDELLGHLPNEPEPVTAAGPGIAEPAAAGTEQRRKVDELLKGRAFVGSKLSGSRQVAELVLRHYDVNLAAVDCDWEMDWEQMLRSLDRGELHLAFFLGETSSELMRRLASRGRFRLVSLDPEAVEAIRATEPQIATATIPRGTYGVRGDDPPGGGSFCVGPVVTIATRRVVLCPSEMPSGQASWLSGRIRDAVRDDVPSIRWESTDSADAADQPGTAFVYPLHAAVSGEVRRSMEQVFRFIPSPLWSIVILGLTWAATRALQFVTPKAVPPAPAADEGSAHARQESAAVPGPSGQSNGKPEVQPTPAAGAGVAGRIRMQIDDYLREIRDARDPLPRAAAHLWRRRIAGIAHAINAERRRKALGDADYHVLMKGLGELSCEFELVKQPPDERPAPQDAPSKTSE